MTESNGKSEHDRQDLEKSTTNSKEFENYDIEMLHHLENDLQHTHSEMLQTFTDLSGAAGRLLGFIGTTLAVIVGAAALVDNIQPYINLANIFGMIFILGSAVITMIGHSSRRVSTGFGRDDLETALRIEPDGNGPDDGIVYTQTGEKPLTEHDYLVWASRNYVRWIEDARKKNSKKSQELYLARVIYVSGILLLLSGTLMANPPLLFAYVG